jgi:hypothetical protein
MGDELSCPCGNRQDITDLQNNNKVQKDIIEEVMQGKLSKDELIYQCSSTNDILCSKICLLGSKNIEGFFANRNLLIIDNKNEINLYYSNIFISNFLNQNDLACVILQYKKGNEDKSQYYLKNSISNSIALSHSTNYSKKKMMKYNNDINAIYKVDTINFVSNNREKIKEQILNDLYSQLKKEYFFYGILKYGNSDNIENIYKHNNYNKINDKDINKDFVTPGASDYEINQSFFNNMSKKIENKNYKILYKKSKFTDNLEINYSVDILNERLNSNSITKILKQNKDKTLKSVIKEINENENEYPFIYFFIFEGNNITPEYDENEFLVVKIEREKTTTEGFLKDIVEKINFEKTATLLTVINDDNGFFLVFKFSFDSIDEDETVTGN